MAEKRTSPWQAKPQPKKKGRAKKARRGFRWLPWLAATFGVLLLFAAVGAFGTWEYFLHKYGNDVPDISWAQNYRPPLVSSVLSGDDQLLAEFCNRDRPHSAFGGRTPDEVFFGKLRPRCMPTRITYFDGHLCWYKFG